MELSPSKSSWDVALKPFKAVVVVLTEFVSRTTVYHTEEGIKGPSYEKASPMLCFTEEPLLNQPK